MNQKKRLWLLVAMATVIALVIAACGGDDPTSTPLPRPTPTTAGPSATTVGPTPTTVRPTATPVPVFPTSTPTPEATQIRRGGILRQRELVSFIPMDTYNLRSAFSMFMVQNIVSGFIRLDGPSPSFVEPDIAESWTLNPDAKTYIFKIRRGVTFHDGTPLTSEHVLFNLNRGWNKDNEFGALIGKNKERFALVEEITAPDDFTITIKLTRPSASFLIGLGVPFLLMYPSFIGDISENWVANPLGTGPFVMTQIDPDISMTLERYDNYYFDGDDGLPLPYLDGQEIFFIRDPGAALAAFRAGRVDCGCGIEFFTPNTDEIAKSLPDHTFFKSNQDAIHYYFANKAPWDDIRVRRAVHLAINFDTLVKVARGGLGSYPPTDLLSRSVGGVWAIPDEEMLQKPGYRLVNGEKHPDDLAESASLLAAAGIDPGDFTIKLHISATFSDFGEVFASELQSAGWKVNLTVLPSGSGAQYTQLRQALDFDIAFQQGGRAIDDPSELTLASSVTGGGENWGRWSIPEIDTLAVEQEAELDVMKRRQLVLQLQEILLDEMVRMPAMNIAFAKGFAPRVRGVAIGRFSATTAHRHERVWLTED